MFKRLDLNANGYSQDDLKSIKPTISSKSSTNLSDIGYWDENDGRSSSQINWNEIGHWEDHSACYSSVGTATTQENNHINLSALNSIKRSVNSPYLQQSSNYSSNSKQRFFNPITSPPCDSAAYQGSPKLMKERKITDEANVQMNSPIASFAD